MTRKRRRIIFFLFLLNFIPLLATIVFSLLFNPWDVIENGKNYDCVFQKIFGIYCPGCGGTRAVGYLLSFDFFNSFIFYPPLFVGIFLILYADYLLFLSFKKDSFEPIKKHKYFEFLLIPASILLTFFIRNIFLYFGVDFLGDFLS